MEPHRGEQRHRVHGDAVEFAPSSPFCCGPRLRQTCGFNEDVNLILVVGAAAAIAQTGVGTGDQVVALAVFVLLGTLGPGIPVGIYFLMRDRASAILDGLRAWMVRENATIMAVLCLIIGAKLIGDAASALAT
jgi:hypothetical protein